MIDDAKVGRDVKIIGGEGDKLYLDNVKSGRDVEISGAQANDKLMVKEGDISVEAAMGSIKTEAMQKIELICGGSSITMTPDKISIKSAQVEVKGTATSHVDGGMSTKITSGGAVIVQAPVVKLN